MALTGVNTRYDVLKQEWEELLARYYRQLKLAQKSGDSRATEVAWTCVETATQSLEAIAEWQKRAQS